MKKRIDEIAEDIEKELLERVTESPGYAILVDEPTDLDNKALLLYIYYSTYQEDGHEDILCALLLPTKTTARELFKSIIILRAASGCST